MATAALAPSPGIGRIEDPVTIKESVRLFAETCHPVPESTLRRWVKQDKLDCVRRGGDVWYSDSDMLELHRRRVFGM